jgi:hypothetical protein
LLDPTIHGPSIELLAINLRLQNTYKIKWLEDEIQEWEKGWPKTIGLFLADKLSEGAFVAESLNGDKKRISMQKCECFYYIGVKNVVSGDYEKSRESFAKAVDAGRRGMLEFELARAELKLSHGYTQCGN